MKCNGLGITFNGLHSFDDLGLWIIKKQKDTPAPIKIYKTVPYMDSSYDFSSVYGRDARGDRKIYYTFRISEDFKQHMEIKLRRLNAWLNTSKRLPLYDDVIKDLYYMAECTNISEPEEEAGRTSVTVEFTAYPYMIGDYLEGKLLWDDICFETDYFVETSFSVSGIGNNIEVYNQSAHEIVPTVICSATMHVQNNSENFTFYSGETYDENFVLKEGTNSLIVTVPGNNSGTIDFAFYKEVL